MSGRFDRALGLATGVPEGALALVVGYLTVLTAGAWRATAAGAASTALEQRPRHRFAVLIPAHDEERLIGSTLQSLAAMDYPAELVAIHVVADNCTDNTAAVARAHGADVHEHDDLANRGKGPALQWLLDRLGERGHDHDAVVFIDADTTVSPNFLRVADALLTQGAPVVQAHYAVRDPGSSPVVAFRAAALAARHYVRPLGRTWLGGSAGLFGNGMVFRTDVLGARSWSDHLTEDIELHLELVLRGTRVVFAPDAVVEAEMPATLSASRTQHERWERGRAQIARRFVPRLLRRAATDAAPGRFAHTDAAIDQAVPPFSVVAAATAAVGLASLARAGWAPSPAARRGVARAALLVLAQAAYVLSALRMVKAPAAVYRSLVQAPQFVVWKIGLWLRVLVSRRDIDWIRTARNPSHVPVSQGAS